MQIQISAFVRHLTKSFWYAAEIYNIDAVQTRQIFQIVRNGRQCLEGNWPSSFDPDVDIRPLLSGAFGPGSEKKNAIGAIWNMRANYTSGNCLHFFDRR